MAWHRTRGGEIYRMLAAVPAQISTHVSKQIVVQLPKHYLSFPLPTLHTIGLTRFRSFSIGLGYQRTLLRRMRDRRQEHLENLGSHRHPRKKRCGGHHLNLVAIVGRLLHCGTTCVAAEALDFVDAA